MKYTLMHRDCPVCDFITDDGSEFSWVGKVMAPERLPLQCQQDGREVIDTIGYWWEGRSIPRYRPHVSAAQRVHGCWTQAQLAMANLGVSLSDHYWIRPQDRDDLTWENVNCYDNAFPAGCGNYLFFNEPYAESLNGGLAPEAGFSPDASTNGMLRKHWEIGDDGTRRLVKASGFNIITEAVCEVVFAQVCELIGVSSGRAELRLDEQESNAERRLEPCCAIDCIATSDLEIVTANAMRFGCHTDDRLSLYEKTVDVFSRLCERDMRSYLERMLVVDYLLCNQDRHFSSFGLLRKSRTMQYVGMCPLFDNGASLWSSSIFNASVGEEDNSITFAPTQTEQVHLVKDVSWLDNNKLNQVPDVLHNRLLTYEQYIRGVAPTDKYMRRVDKIISSVVHRVNHLEYAL